MLIPLHNNNKDLAISHRPGIIIDLYPYSSLLYEVEFIKKVTWHLVEKLVSTDKGSDRVVQLLEGLSILCACKGAPITQNQSK